MMLPGFRSRCKHAAAVGVGNRVAHIQEPAQELAKLQRPLAGVAARVGLVKALDGVLEAVAFDEAHGVEGPAVGVLAQAVDGNDAGMLQAAGDLGLQEEAGTAVGCRRRGGPGSA